MVGFFYYGIDMKCAWRPTVILLKNCKFSEHYTSNVKETHTCYPL